VARALGINHVALEVGSVDEALAWYGRFLDFELRGRRPHMAWIELGDQFLALAEAEVGSADGERHFGLVVDDKEDARRRLAGIGVDVPSRGHLRFPDPWGNNVEIVDYRDVQFTKSSEALASLGVEGIAKSESALVELREKGLVP
jgi:catechol 2,3-dioxygenase-like lactoylglutathione lyase family enzyme